MKLANFVANFLSAAGLKHVFILTGGGAMHLNNAFGKDPLLTPVFMHHEQALAMAAESYARLIHQPAIVNVTTGPGGINALNGVFGAWVDSIPMIVISGQVRSDTLAENANTPELRQLGDQECNIIKMVGGITKYAVTIKNPNDILYHLQKALFLATNGRPGPVWLDIPMNIQTADIDPNTLHQFHNKNVIPDLDATVTTFVINKLKLAKRPVILAGTAVRSSGARDLFFQLLEHIKIPVVTAWNAHDILPDTHPCNSGRPGTVGDRAGNFCVQNADLLLILGCRLNIRQISYNWKSFAREAYKIMVDIDAAELKKPTLNIDLPIHTNVKNFMSLLNNALQDFTIEKKEWIDWCQDRRKKYPVVLPEYWKKESPINPYCFMKTLSECVSEDQIIVTGDGTASVTTFQSFVIKNKTRLYSNSGCASMGYDLPAAIGACIASGNKKIVCLAGDGSIMQNIQELETIAFKKYPVKIFILNNQGYHSIRQTQENFFEKPYVGVGEDSGLGFPNFENIAKGFSIAYSRCENHAMMEKMIRDAMKDNSPHICEVMLDLSQPFAPKLSSKRLADGRIVTNPLEDMAPFLSEEELQANMLTPIKRNE